jgi:uncharacterized protein YcbK (DUF882 family)
VSEIDAIDESRRRLLTAGASMLASSLALPSWATSDERAASEFWLQPRRIVLRHAVGERLDATYWSDGEIIASEYQRISHFMRDRVTGYGVWMHPVLLDILYAVGGWLRYFGVTEPIVLTSGCRDPVRNQHIEGAALNSLHPKGEAADIRIPHVNPLQVSRFGVWLGGGGVGWYPEKQFTHLDRGRLRTWRGTPAKP